MNIKNENKNLRIKNKISKNVKEPKNCLKKRVYTSYLVVNEVRNKINRKIYIIFFFYRNHNDNFSY